MKCPRCGFQDTRVVDSRPAEDNTMLRRRRQCDNCQMRFTTHERLAQTRLIVVKKDGRREDFSREKLRMGLDNACAKLAIPVDEIERIIAEVEALLRQETGSEVTSEQIGDEVMERLYSLNEVAYVRFASVYQRFEDVKRYAQLLERLPRTAKKKPARGLSGDEKSTA